MKSQGRRALQEIHPLMLTLYIFLYTKPVINTGFIRPSNKFWTQNQYIGHTLAGG
jgi:hypothetical protein